MMRSIRRLLAIAVLVILGLLSSCEDTTSSNEDVISKDAGSVDIMLTYGSSNDGDEIRILADQGIVLFDIELVHSNPYQSKVIDTLWVECDADSIIYLKIAGKATKKFDVSKEKEIKYDLRFNKVIE